MRQDTSLHKTSLFPFVKYACLKCRVVKIKNVSYSFCVFKGIGDVWLETA